LSGDQTDLAAAQGMHHRHDQAATKLSCPPEPLLAWRGMSKVFFLDSGWIGEDL
jgi:hypothetical protein